jgi:aminoglycoside phosphotransferase (APT) family kinase protein
MDGEQLPADVRDHFGLAGPAHRLQGGLMAATFDCGELIVQHVSNEPLDHHRALVTLAGLLPTGTLPGLDGFLPRELVRDDGGFWRAAHKLPGRTAASETSDTRLAALLSAAMGDVCSELEALAKAGRRPEVMSLAITPWKSQIAGQYELRQRLDMRTDVRARVMRALCDLAPADLASGVVLTHGDVVPKNMLVSEDRTVLIDYELCGYAPAHHDVGIFASTVSRRLPAATALSLTSEMLRLRGLPASGDAPRAVAFWGTVRDFTLWSDNASVSPAQSSFQKDCLAAAERLLAD